MMKKNNFFSRFKSPPQEEEAEVKSLWTSKTALKIFSILAAIGFWVAISSGAGVQDTRTLYDIPIEFNASFGLKVVTSDPKTIDLQVTGPRYVVGNLDKEDILVTAVTNDVTVADTYSLVLKATPKQGVSGDFTIHSFSTTTVVASFDTYTEMIYDITAEPQNVVAETGYALGIETIDPAQVKVTGPFSTIQKITTAVARYPAPTEEKVSQNFTTSAKVILLDSEGKEINMNGVVIDPAEVEISVPVLKTKTLPITLKFINAPDGFAESDYYSIEPAEIEIAGPADVVDGMSSFQLTTIDLSKYLASETVYFPITTPESTQIISNFTEAAVMLDYSKIKNKQMTISNFEITGLPAGFTATVATTRLENVRILSPSSTINSITESDLVAIIDLTDKQLSTGRIEVSVSIRSKRGRMVWAYGTYTVLVNVKATG